MTLSDALQLAAVVFTLLGTPLSVVVSVVVALLIFRATTTLRLNALEHSAKSRDSAHRAEVSALAGDLRQLSGAVQRLETVIAERLPAPRRRAV